MKLAMPPPTISARPRPSAGAAGPVKCFGSRPPALGPHQASAAQDAGLVRPATHPGRPRRPQPPSPEVPPPTRPPTHPRRLWPHPAACAHTGTFLRCWARRCTRHSCLREAGREGQGRGGGHAGGRGSAKELEMGAREGSLAVGHSRATHTQPLTQLLSISQVGHSVGIDHAGAAAWQGQGQGERGPGGGAEQGQPPECPGLPAASLAAGQEGAGRRGVLPPRTRHHGPDAAPRVEDGELERGAGGFVQGVDASLLRPGARHCRHAAHRRQLLRSRRQGPAGP